MKKIFVTLSMMVATALFAASAFAATNPFMDVPQGHWSYDAVGLLASRGMVSGYPDGAFKGAQPATRYEMASIVARALVTVDAEKASAQDMELLKKLVMEFKDELDALGVKVDALDKRVAAIEDKLGGWKISGQFYFEADFANGESDNGGTKYSESGNDNSFQKSRFRLSLEKQLSENTSFYAQFRTGSESGGGTSGYGDFTQINVREIFLTTVLPGDIQFHMGRIFWDFEYEHGLWYDNDALFGDLRIDGFDFAKDWGTFRAKAVVGRNIGNEWYTYGIFNKIAGTSIGNGFFTNEGYWLFALDMTWKPTENFFFGLTGSWLLEDSDSGFTNYSTFDPTTEYLEQGGDIVTYGAYMSYNFTPAIKLQGLYYYQDIDDGVLAAGADMDMSSARASTIKPYGSSITEDNPQAWKIILDLKQDVLKFTGLHLEYQEMDNTFVATRDSYTFDVNTGNSASVSNNLPWNDNTTKYYFAIAEQKWNDKWSSYIRYTYADFDTDDIDDAQSYGIGITYQYTPAIAFRLAYDCVDYGDTNVPGFYKGDDHVIQFRTAINF